MKSQHILNTLAASALFAISACSQPAIDKKDIQVMTDQNHTILINPFVVPEDQLEDTIIMWEQARDYLQTQPGYVSTALHQSLTPDSKFRLINVATWESAEAFQKANANMQKEANLPKLEGVVANPSLFTVIRRD